MKGVYGLLAIGVVALVAFWVIGSDANRFQVEPGPVQVPNDVYDPVAAGETVPVGYRQLLPRDAIFPVYNPTFTAASEAPWGDETLIIGVEQDGESKAYPVSFLNRREMVIDWIGGSPVLVTW